MYHDIYIYITLVATHSNTDNSSFAATLHCRVDFVDAEVDAAAPEVPSTTIGGTRALHDVPGHVPRSKDGLFTLW